MNALFFGLLWIGFAGYAFVLAPPEAPNTFALIMQIIQGDTAQLNPLVVNLFNLMGILPLIYGCLLIPLDHGRKFPAGIIVTLMMGVGAFALLPYLALRRAQPEVKTIPWWVRFFDSRWLALPLGVGALLLVAAGLQGDWPSFIRQWQQERFIHVMSLDFLVLTVLLPVLVIWDMERRKIKDTRYFWLSALIPLFGPVLYLMIRPSLDPNVN